MRHGLHTGGDGHHVTPATGDAAREAELWIEELIEEPRRDALDYARLCGEKPLTPPGRLCDPCDPQNEVVE